MSTNALRKIDQKEYLKKYLSGDKVKKKKKGKKHKTSSPSSAKVKIIDDDVQHFNSGPQIDEELLLTGDDAPQIVGEYIEENLAESKLPKWKSIGIKEEPQDGQTSNARSEDVLWGKKSTDLKTKKDKQRSKNTPDISPHRLKDKEREYSALSPPQITYKKGKYSQNSLDYRNKIKRESRTPDKSMPSVRRVREKDSSPPRRERSTSSFYSKRDKRKDSDESPPRNKNLYGSLPSKTLLEQASSRRRPNSDQTPPRRDGGNSPDQSPPRKVKNRPTEQSPLRKRKNSDSSPPRKGMKRSPNQSPQRKRNSDQSPVRRGRNHSPDFSPPRRKRKNSDQSPLRRDRNRSTNLSQRRSRQSSDKSPTRKGRYNSTDQSPPSRRRNSDQSPPRRNKNTSPLSSRNSPAKHIKREKLTPDLSPCRRSRWERQDSEKSLSPPLTHKPKPVKTLEGKKAGLQDAQALHKESLQRRKQENLLFEKMSSDISGRYAEVQVRSTGRKGRRVREEDPEERKRKEEQEEKIKQLYDCWGKGLKQIEDHKNRLHEQAHESSKPFARYEGDEDLERHLKEQERPEDPMLEYMRQKRKEKEKQSGKPQIPRYEGPFPENRFGIRPGYRWDGVDRSNGYEKKYFSIQNEKRARQDEAYKYSVEDM